MKEFRFRAKDDALTAIEELRAVTGRKELVEVVIDAFRMYEWLLRNQALGNSVLIEPKATNGEPPEEVIAIPSYVKDFDAVKKHWS